jgi:hypothetical protein
MTAESGHCASEQKSGDSILRAAYARRALHVRSPLAAEDHPCLHCHRHIHSRLVGRPLCKPAILRPLWCFPCRIRPHYGPEIVLRGMCGHVISFVAALTVSRLQQHPAHALQQDRFQEIDEYIITKPQLSGRTVVLWVFSGRPPVLFSQELRTSACGESVIVGYPAVIEHKKYSRNALQFNLGVVLPVSADTRPWEHVVRKIGAFLIDVEVLGHIIFCQRDSAIHPHACTQIA